MKPLRTLLIAAAAGIGGLCAASAFAMDNTASQRWIVKYDDLDLTSERGAQLLYKRLTNASKRVCSTHEARDPRHPMAWQNCFDHALTSAVLAINAERVTALHQRSRNEQPS